MSKEQKGNKESKKKSTTTLKERRQAKRTKKADKKNSILPRSFSLHLSKIRKFYAAFKSSTTGLTRTLASGLRVTVVTGLQFRVLPDHRKGAVLCALT